MVEAKFGNDYLGINSTTDGDIAIIIGEGEYGELTYQGKTKQVLNLPVECNGKKVTFTPNNRSGSALIAAFGKETKNWIGKKFTVLHVEGKMMIRPIKTENV